MNQPVYFIFMRDDEQVAVVEWPSLDDASAHLAMVATDQATMPFEWDACSFHYELPDGAEVTHTLDLPEPTEIVRTPGDPVERPEPSFDDLIPTGETWIARGRNEERAGWARTAVEAFRFACGGDMDETALYDLVGNLGHLCDQLSAEYANFNLTFEGMVDMARHHYEAERAEGDDIDQVAA